MEITVELEGIRIDNPSDDTVKAAIEIEYSTPANPKTKVAAATKPPEKSKPFTYIKPRKIAV